MAGLFDYFSGCRFPHRSFADGVFEDFDGDCVDVGPDPSPFLALLDPFAPTDPIQVHGGFVANSPVRQELGQVEKTEIGDWTVCHITREPYTLPLCQARVILVPMNSLTNQIVGNQLGISHSMVSRLRAGTRLPGPELIERIASVYKLPLDELLRARNKGAEEFSRLFRLKVFKNQPPLTSNKPKQIAAA